MSVSLSVRRRPHGLQIATYVRSKLDYPVDHCERISPSGGVESGETLIDALTREVAEQTQAIARVPERLHKRCQLP